MFARNARRMRRLGIMSEVAAAGIIAIGTWVRVTRDTGPLDFKGCIGQVTGYETRPPRITTRLWLTRPGDVTFKYPLVFPWCVKVIEPPVEEEEHDHAHD